MMDTVFKGVRVPTCMDAPSLDTLHLKAEQGEDPRRDEAREMGKNSSHEEGEPENSEEEIARVLGFRDEKESNKFEDASEESARTEWR
ncbi:hypothetical protein TGPRC2_297492 [Toxoplasma gondii TgCatPRC2]|uniref:Uncharacterized protein n=1 Tax=Toxoplasma gondii TgCatPRC2 TaxID=1130821 RepID=A0A151H217_TOXGO|nr:hypothetical protein TGPRC2_297492 [Toxoplasma gondii TgCatPRC2]